MLSLFPGRGFEVSLGEMGMAVPKLGLSAKSCNMTVEEIRSKRPLGVLHVGETHFVALVGYEKNAVFIVDSLYKGEGQPVRWLWDDLRTRWDGAILVISRK